MCVGERMRPLSLTRFRALVRSFCLAVCCSMMQCVATCCYGLFLPLFVSWSRSRSSILFLFPFHSFTLLLTLSDVSQCVAVCRSVLQCVVVCCSVLHTLSDVARSYCNKGSHFIRT